MIFIRPSWKFEQLFIRGYFYLARRPGQFFNASASISKVRTVASKELSIKKELIIARTRKSSFQRVALIFFASGSDFELSKEFSSQSFGLHSNFGGKNLDSQVFKVALVVVMACLSSRLAHAWKVLGAGGAQ